MKYPDNKRRQHRGFSLVELMVGLSVGLIVVAGISAVYVLSRSNFAYQRELSAMQEDARNITYAIVSDLKASGFNVCANAGEYSNRLAMSTVPWTAANWTVSARFPVLGSTGDTFGLIPASNNPRADSDTLLIQGVDRNSGATVTAHDATNGRITLSTTGGIVAGQPLLLTDCRQTSLIVVSSVDMPNNWVFYTAGTGAQRVCSSMLGGTCDNPLPYTFRAGSIAYAVRGAGYAVGKFSTWPQDVLWRVDIPTTGAASQASLAARNVEMLQISYGVDTNNDGAPDQYFATADMGAPGVSDNWRKVVSVRVAILLVSERNNLSPTAQTYVFNGQTITATDNRLRFPYETTVYLRNHFQ